MGNLSDDIVKYKKGELSAPEMHALEKKALVDPFLAEALEGVEDISSNELTEDVSSLNKKITNRKKKILFTPLRIAAGIALLLGSAFLIYQWVPRPETISLKMEKPKPENKNTKGEKAGSGNQPKEASNKKTVDQRGKSKVENKKLTVESAVQESGKSESPVKREEQAATKIRHREFKNENAEAEILAPVTQAPAQDSSVQQQLKIENDEDQLAKEIAGPEQKAAGAKSVSGERRKSSLAASKVERSVPSTKTNMPKSIFGHVVSSDDGSPLPGVNVILKGTTIGTVTDSNGDYKISADLDNRSLVFSFIGLQSQEIDASHQDKVDVQMKEDVSQLSEVIVIAMGVAKDDQAEPVIKWAEPEGGRKAYDAYLESNVKYPEEALKNKIKGKAGIEFTVGTDGSLSDFRVFKKLGYGCEDEIVRLVKGGPKWNPTTEDNKPVESTVRVRLRFDPAKMAR
jgi:hypothetical protein